MSLEANFDEVNQEPELSQGQRNKMLMEVHECLMGDPLHNKPGLAAKVDRHDKAIFGSEAWGGLISESRRNNRLIWIGTGLFMAANVIWAYWAVVHTYAPTPTK